MYDVVKLQSPEEENTFVELIPERGGILTDYVFKGQPILYMDDEQGITAKSIHGGIPVLFPVCGPLEGGRYVIKGEEWTMPQHGFARNLPWAVDQIEKLPDESTVRLSLRDTEESRRLFPFSFQMTLTYKLRKGQLEVAADIVNLSRDEMPFQLGFHPYFHLSCPEAFSSNLVVRDSTDMLSEAHDQGAVEKIFQSRSADEITNFYCNSVSGAPEFKMDNVHIQLELDAALDNLVFWSLKGKPFICIEPWTGLPGGFNRGEMRWLNSHDSFHTGFVVHIKLD